MKKVTEKEYDEFLKDKEWVHQYGGRHSFYCLDKNTRERIAFYKFNYSTDPDFFYIKAIT